MGDRSSTVEDMDKAQMNPPPVVVGDAGFGRTRIGQIVAIACGGLAILLLIVAVAVNEWAKVGPVSMGYWGTFGLSKFSDGCDATNTCGYVVKLWLVLVMAIIA